MADTPQIPAWNGSRLMNGQFLNYAKDVARIAAGFPGDQFPVAAKVATLNAAIGKLTDFIKESRKAAETADVVAADARRDLIFRAIWGFLDAAGQLDGNDGYAKAARHVQALLSPYKSLHTHALTKETEEIEGLKFDMEKDPATAEAVVTLGLDNALSALYAANNAVKAAYTQRADSQAAQGAEHFGDTTVSVRKECLNAMLDVFKTLNAIAVIAPGQDVTDTVIRLIQAVEQHKKVAAQNGKRPQTPDGGDDGDGGSDGGETAPETAE